MRRTYHSDYSDTAQHKYPLLTDFNDAVGNLDLSQVNTTSLTPSADGVKFTLGASGALVTSQSFQANEVRAIHADIKINPHTTTSYEYIFQLFRKVGDGAKFHHSLFYRQSTGKLGITYYGSSYTATDEELLSVPQDTWLSVDVIYDNKTKKMSLKVGDQTAITTEQLMEFYVIDGRTYMLSVGNNWRGYLNDGTRQFEGWIKNVRVYDFNS